MCKVCRICDISLEGVTLRVGDGNICKACLKESKRLYRMKSLGKVKENRRLYDMNNRERLTLARKKYILENKDKINKKHKEWLENNKERVKAKRREYKIRKLTEPLYRMQHNISTRIRQAILKQQSSKTSSSFELLGASGKEVFDYITKKLHDGMTWENYGEWHIDHIIPCDLFDLTKIDEQKRCFHYTNLQPMWGGENISKSNKIEVLTSEGLFTL